VLGQFNSVGKNERLLRGIKFGHFCILVKYVDSSCWRFNPICRDVKGIEALLQKLSPLFPTFSSGTSREENREGWLSQVHHENGCKNWWRRTAQLAVPLVSLHL